MFDFPNSPAYGQVTVAPNGGYFTWDGLKWINGGGPPAPPLSERDPDVANVLDYGADPTGIRDSSDAINAAASVVVPTGWPNPSHRSVYLPTGIYRVNKQIVLTGPQALYGDSRGASVLFVDQSFDPAATSVITCNANFSDPGPVLRDFGILFEQPPDQNSRANFKTLADGGTSRPGGTGVKYPWAILIEPQPFRLQIFRVRIAGAWNGIKGGCVFFIDDIEVGALDCGMSLGEGSGILDFCHIHEYHFWNFGLGGPAGSIWDVFSDHEPIALRMGRVDGISITGLTTFLGRVIFTGEEGGYSHCTISNFLMDSETIEINGDLGSLNITNFVTGAGTTRVRPLFQLNGRCKVHVTNWYSHSSSSYPDILLTNYGANFTLTNFDVSFYTNNVPWAEVRRGILRITQGYIYTSGPRTVGLFAETENGHLILDDISVNSDTPTGPLVTAVTDNPPSGWTMIGRLNLPTGHTWTFSLPNGLMQTFYSPINRFTGSVFAASLFSDTIVQAGGGSNLGHFVSFGPAGQGHGLLLYRDSKLAWTAGTTGANDDYDIKRWDDNGNFAGVPFIISRATGMIGFGAGGIGFNGTAAITKRTGWGAPTGTATRATFVTGSVTLPVLAEHVKALIDDLTAYGLIGT